MAIQFFYVLRATQDLDITPQALAILQIPSSSLKKDTQVNLFTKNQASDKHPSYSNHDLAQTTLSNHSRS